MASHQRSIHPTLKKVIVIFSRIIAVLVLILLIFIITAFIYSVVPAKVVNNNVPFTNPLIIPPILNYTTSNGEKIFDQLSLQAGKTNFFRDRTTNTWGINGSYLGPTIRAHVGDKVAMNIKNNLDEATTIHWHGMHLPGKMDGGPHQEIFSQETWNPYWTIRQNAATLWYHSHQMGKTGPDVYKGLAGLFILDDDNSDKLPIPKTYGVDDIPLIVQDRAFDNNEQFIYQNNKKDFVGHTGMLGDTILVNGTYSPYINVKAKKIRLRILNASNARRYNFAFSDKRIFYQIATDGGFLESPIARNELVLTPGERAEIVVDLSKTTKPLVLLSKSVKDDNIFFDLVKGVLNGERDQHQAFKILELRPQPTKELSAALPAKLTSIHRWQANDAVKTRTFVLSDDLINNKKMEPARIDETVKKGAIELWKISNSSGEYHTFHVHDVQFQIFERNGKPPPDYERGWKDTVFIPDKSVVTLIMQFRDYSDPQAPYMFHCHLLEHEDMGMMGQFLVVDSLSENPAAKFKSNLKEMKSMNMN